jgi:hypothetical protein
MTDTANREDKYLSARELATALVEYEFQSPEARYKSHRELIEYYTQLIKSHDQQIALDRDDEELEWINGLINLLGTGAPSGQIDDYILKRHGILNVRLKRAQGGK